MGNPAYCNVISVAARTRACYRAVDNLDIVTHVPPDFLNVYAHPSIAIYWLDPGHKLRINPPALPSDRDAIAKLPDGFLTTHGWRTFPTRCRSPWRTTRLSAMRNILGCPRKWAAASKTQWNERVHPPSNPLKHRALCIFACDRKSKAIINRIQKLLLAPDVSLGCLDRSVPKQKPNLFEFAAAIMAESGTGATKIVGRQIGYAGLPGTPFDRIPDYVRCHASFLSHSHF